VYYAQSRGVFFDTKSWRTLFNERYPSPGTSSEFTYNEGSTKLIYYLNRNL